MTCLIEVKCPDCNLPFVGRHGKGRKGDQRYLCQNEGCKTKSFMLEYHYRVRNRGIEKDIVKMAINSNGIRDTSRVPGVNKTAVMNVLKSKETLLLQVNPNITTMKFDDGSCVRFEPACEMAELDKQWSYVGNKANQRWLLLAIDHTTGTVPAYVFRKRKDEVIRQLQVLLEPSVSAVSSAMTGMHMSETLIWNLEWIFMYAKPHI